MSVSRPLHLIPVLLLIGTGAQLLAADPCYNKKTALCVYRDNPNSVTSVTCLGGGNTGSSYPQTDDVIDKQNPLASGEEGHLAGKACGVGVRIVRNPAGKIILDIGDPCGDKFLGDTCTEP